MNKINHIKAYLLGLIVGGGKIDKDTFVIDLPFNKWGMEPSRMNIIAKEIITKIRSNFYNSYAFNINYDLGNGGKWLIKPIDCADISPLIDDLQFLGLPTSGFLLSATDLTIAKKKLTGINVESFLSGIFDARASLTPSHRRFNDFAPTVSLEIPGSTRNFKLVVQLCSWLTDLGSITDQILYNHPNQHSPSDPYYKGWQKGFKIRFLVKSFLTKNSFALQAKSFDVQKTEKQQKKEEQPPCYLRKIIQVSSVSVHSEQNSQMLPDEVRNKLFFHYLHFCAVLGCRYAPLDEIKKLVMKKNSLINFFPRLSKGISDELKKDFLDIQSFYYPNKKIYKQSYVVKELVSNETLKPYSTDQGIAYLFAQKLNGKRHTGSMSSIIEDSLEENLIVMAIGEKFEGPLLIINPLNERAFICSTVSNTINQDLIEKYVSTDMLTVNIMPHE